MSPHLLGLLGVHSLGLFSGTLGTDTVVASNTGLLAKGNVSRSLALDAGSGNKLDARLSLVNRQRLEGLGGISALGGGKGQLFVGQNDQVSLVFLETGLVGGQGLFTAVLAAVIDADTDRASQLAGNTGSLQLFQSETTSSLDLHVVLDGRAADDRAQQLSRARTSSGSLGSAGNTASLLLAGLIEPGLDATLPLLVEMSVGDDVVVLHWDLVDGWIEGEGVTGRSTVKVSTHPGHILS